MVFFFYKLTGGEDCEDLWIYGIHFYRKVGETFRNQQNLGNYLNWYRVLVLRKIFWFKIGNILFGKA